VEAHFCWWYHFGKRHNTTIGWSICLGKPSPFPPKQMNPPAPEKRPYWYYVFRLGGSGDIIS
jgi:hypothetical protein